MPVIPSQSSERQRRKAVVEELLRAALLAVEPSEAVRRAVRRENNALLVNGQRYELGRYRRLLIVGAGKAAPAMASAIEDLLFDKIAEGLVITKPGYSAVLNKIALLEGGHPIPDQDSVRAARAIARLVSAARSDDLVICLVSGGASALMALPASGLSLSSKRRITDLLLRSGATIDEINCVRTHISAIKGGRLAVLAMPATLVTLILSDVVGNHLHVVGSGPTAPDPTTYTDAYSVLQKYQILDRAPKPVIGILERGMAGDLPETPKADHEAFAKVQNAIVADNHIALEAALNAASNRGWNTMLLSSYLQGEAREVGKVLAGIGREIVASGKPLAVPACVVAGGEPTVTVRGPGVGGRNQELALAAGIALAGMENLGLASIATDGGDGITTAAGAYVDGQTVNLARAIGLNPVVALASNDSHTFFSALGDLIVTGPTNTNVNDLIFLMAFDVQAENRESDHTVREVIAYE